MKRWLIPSVCLLLPLVANAAVLSPGEAAKHVGKNATVCGVVASEHYASRSRGHPTFLDIGHAYPDEDFTAVVWGADRSKFSGLDQLQGQRICVTGTIRQYRGRPEVILRDGSQLKE